MHIHLFWSIEDQFARLQLLLLKKVRGVTRVGDRVWWYLTSSNC